MMIMVFNDDIRLNSLVTMKEFTVAIKEEWIKSRM